MPRLPPGSYLPGLAAAGGGLVPSRPDFAGVWPSCGRNVSIAPQLGGLVACAVLPARDHAGATSELEHTRCTVMAKANLSSRVLAPEG